jgi:hypothetical protein
MSGNGKGTEKPPTYFNDCVSKNERAVLDDKLNEILQQITNLARRVEDVEQRRPEPHRVDEEEEELQDEDARHAEAEAEARCANARNRDRLNFNRRGMGGNDRGNKDPFSKTKFKMLPFSGSADPEAYLDWEMTVDQKFSSHQVPEEHRVRLATSEFTSFALFWWNDICNNANAQIPQTWAVLKRRMKTRFVPPYY